MWKTWLHINFEWIDWVWKTTQYDLLAKKIWGFQVSSYTYDWIKNIRKRIEELSICNLDLRCSYYLMSSLHDNEVIKEKVQWWEDVVSDRWILSTLAYHRAMWSSLAKWIDLEKLNIRLPDYTIHLKLSEEERMQRIGLRWAELWDKYWERDSISYDWYWYKLKNNWWSFEWDYENFRKINNLIYLWKIEL